MPTLNTVTATNWIEITAGTSGSLYLQEGNSTGYVAIAQAEKLPTTEINETPLLTRMKLEQSNVYFNIPTGSKIYARSNVDTWQLADSPAEANS